MTVEFMHRLAREIIALAEAVLEEKDPGCAGGCWGLCLVRLLSLFERG